MQIKKKLFKNSAYFTGERRDLLSMIPKNIDRVLDVGCGDGRFGKLIKDHALAKEVFGVEINENAAQIARLNLDYVSTIDIENPDFNFDGKKFDLIVFADVLEHLYDPWKILKKTQAFLEEDGYFLISVPNIRYYRILAGLFFKDDFKYEDSGILDIDHIRFFTFKTIKDSLLKSNFEIIKLKRNYSGHISFLFNLVTLNIFSNLFTRQYIILAKRKSLN